MNFTDFIYDDICLSDFGCVICTFDSDGGIETITGSDISFNTVSVMNGKMQMLSSSQYDTSIEAEFQICRNPCEITDEEEKYFSIFEQGNINRWLNRMTFHKLRLINSDGEYCDVYYEGSFNVDAIKHNSKVVGFNLRFRSNRPFAICNDRIYRFTIDRPDGRFSINDSSDEIGYLYLTTEVTCKSSGNLRITNKKTNRTTEIRNCSVGEVITIKDMIITTSNAEHTKTIMDDFNYVFPTIHNELLNRMNTYSFSIPCDVVFKYNPVRKVGI